MLQDVPTTLGGRYRIVERLGRGGMADVYRAEDIVLRRDVAIKIFRGGVERDAHLARFRAEVRTLARLGHPHLVALYDAGGDVTEPWCAMEYVDGGSLGDREAVVPPEGMARLGAHIAAALAYVHEQGIVHRDVKPSNVLLDQGGDAFLSDFGIARLVDGTRMTQSGLMIGTAAYLSPEQVRGQTAGPASDVYALALVMLEGLTGRREYPGSPVESAVARLSRSPDVPEELGSDWTELLTAMAAMDAADRPSAQAVCARLARIVGRTGAVITDLEARELPARAPAPPGAEPPDDAAETAGAETSDAGAETAEAETAGAGRPDLERTESLASEPDRIPPPGLPVLVLRPDLSPDEAPAAAPPLAASQGPDQRPFRPAALVGPRSTAGPAELPDEQRRRRAAVTLLVGAGLTAAGAALLPLFDGIPGSSAATLAAPSVTPQESSAASAAATVPADDRQQVFRAPVTLPFPAVNPRRTVVIGPVPTTTPSRTAVASASTSSPTSPSSSASGSPSPTGSTAATQPTAATSSAGVSPSATGSPNPTGTTATSSAATGR